MPTENLMAERIVLLEKSASGHFDRCKTDTSQTHDDSFFSEAQTRRFECMFQQFDINKDGQVSPKELKRALKHMGIKAEIKSCRAMVDGFSLTGYITVENFLGIVTTVFKEGLLSTVEYGVELSTDVKKTPGINEQDLMEAFKKFDKDGSGTISKEELIAQAATLGQEMGEEEVMEFIKQADTDNNGQIDRSEFLHFFSRHYTV